MDQLPLSHYPEKFCQGPYEGIGWLPLSLSRKIIAGALYRTTTLITIQENYGRVLIELGASPFGLTPLFITYKITNSERYQTIFQILIGYKFLILMGHKIS